MKKKTQYAIVGCLKLRSNGKELMISGVVTVDNTSDAENIARARFLRDALNTKDSKGRTYSELGEIIIRRTTEVVGAHDYIELIEGK